MTPEKVKQIGHSVDTQWVTDPVTGEEEQKIVEEELDPENIKKFRIKEDWIFDKERSEMYVRIIGIAPYRAKYDENGNFVADVPMFWIYYPDLRPILANAYAYNMYNDAANLTWGDVFGMRLFDGKIVKVSNVYDRSIEDYKAGKEALYEAQKLEHEELFEYEHDLWSY
jgi:gliding motility associated protien GldN